MKLIIYVVSDGSKVPNLSNITMLTLRFLIWYGHPAGMMTTSPTCCSKVHGSISRSKRALHSYTRPHVYHKQNGIREVILTEFLLKPHFMICVEKKF